MIDPKVLVHALPRGPICSVQAAVPKVGGVLRLDRLRHQKGLPIASINNRQASTGDDARVRFTGDRGGGCEVNLMHSVRWTGPVCVLFRVYLPDDVAITPEDELPVCRLITQKALRAAGDDAQAAMMAGDEGAWMPTGTHVQAKEAGRHVGRHFRSKIAVHLAKLKAHQIGTQFFHPTMRQACSSTQTPPMWYPSCRRGRQASRLARPVRLPQNGARSTGG